MHADYPVSSEGSQLITAIFAKVKVKMFTDPRYTEIETHM